MTLIFAHHILWVEASHVIAVGFVFGLPAMMMSARLPFDERATHYLVQVLSFCSVCSRFLRRMNFGTNKLMPKIQPVVAR